ncbi:hypothetical protein JXB02_04025 [Candidatus Woesearchaeota archaeon]|nr:hypothetical protein [Candidatus Woesearchaeota archaeon]
MRPSPPLRFLTDHRELALVLFAALAARLVFLRDPHEVWWDASVYIGMGRFIFSGGAAGLWEPIRGLVWPFLLGSIQAVGLPLLLSAKVLQILLVLASVVLAYLIGEHAFSRRVAAFSAALVALSSTLFFATFHLYVEPLALALALCGILCWLKGRHLAAGMLLSLAFLAKFPAGMFFGIVVLIEAASLLSTDAAERSRALASIGRMLLGFSFLTIPYLLLNLVLYGSPLFPLFQASEVIGGVVACTSLYLQPWSFYLVHAAKDSALHLFAVLGIAGLAVGLRGERYRRSQLVLLLLFVPALYFQSLACKTPRYFLLMLPGLAFLSAVGIDSLVRQAKRRERLWTALALIAILAVGLLSAITYYHGNERFEMKGESSFYTYLSGKDVDGEVLTTTPHITLYADAPLGLVYYPLFDSRKLDAYSSYVDENRDRIAYVFIDTADIPCPPDDDTCDGKREGFISLLNRTFGQLYREDLGWTERLIFGRRADSAGRAPVAP